MFARFRRGRLEAGIATAVYGAIVAQARTPALYRDLMVPDTVDGRFEMVVAHTILVVRRLGDGDAEARGIGQTVFDLFCQEMDRTLREIGVGDLAVPKRMRGIGEAYYGRAASYQAAIAAGDASSLAAALRRTVFGDEAHAMAAAALADYMIAAAKALAATPTVEVLAARIAWPDVAAFARPENQT